MARVSWDSKILLSFFSVKTSSMYVFFQSAFDEINLYMNKVSIRDSLAGDLKMWWLTPYQCK